MDIVEAENRWRAIGLLYATGFCSIVLIAFSIQHLLFGDPVSAAIAISGLPFMAATLAWSNTKPVMPAWTPYPAIGFLFAMLIYTLQLPEVFEGAPLMWFCAVPPTTMLALRATAGLAASALAFLVLLAGLAFGDHSLDESHAVRLSVTYLFITGLMFTYERARESVIRDLIEAQQRIRTLEGMLRICGWCHGQIRDEAGSWTRTDRFIQARANVEFSHGICPDCQRRVERSLAAPAA